jgi:DNA-binding LacI/PurR family transcriptional regulator
MAARVSMADVAERAGVSAQTVSRVANASPRVDPATRARVEQAMADLGYRMHRAARALRTGRSRTLGVVVSTLSSVGNSRMLEAIAELAADSDYALAVAIARGGSGLSDAFARLRDQAVDGVILINEASSLTRRAALPAAMPLVAIDSPPDERFAVVQTDHAGGAAAAVRHLLAQGHATVHHLAGPAGSYAADERERGWREALRSAGARVPEPERGDWTSASGHAAAARLHEATAVFVANDQMALGALRAFADAGRAVPGEVAVVGFDDVVDAAEYRPPLSTVRQDFGELGRRALEALVALVEAGETPAPSVVPTALVVRDSSR